MIIQIQSTSFCHTPGMIRNVRAMYSDGDKALAAHMFDALLGGEHSPLTQTQKSAALSSVLAGNYVTDETEETVNIGVE